MKKTLFLLFTMLLLALGCDSCHMQPMLRNPQPAKLLDKTVALVTPSPLEANKYLPYCTGVWISQEHILTAKHCITGFDDQAKVGTIIQFKTKDQASILENELDGSPPHAGMVLAFDPDQDLAVISSIENLPIHDITLISNQPIAIGAAVDIVGHTIGMLYTFVRGTVSAERQRSDENVKHLLIQISTAAYKGNSGGGAFDNQGRLIGICSFLTTRAPEMLFFVHRDQILEFLARENLL